MDDEEFLKKTVKEIKDKIRKKNIEKNGTWEDYYDPYVQQELKDFDKKEKGSN